jgi:hypothetical protein
MRKDLIVPDPSDPSSVVGGDPREGEGDGWIPEGKGIADCFNFPSPVSLPPSPEAEKEEEEEEIGEDLEQEEASLPQMPWWEDQKGPWKKFI